MIDRSMARDTPRQAVALEAAKLFGTCAAETNLASACKQAHQQAGHMCASDPIKLSFSTLVRRRPSTYACQQTTTFRSCLRFGASVKSRHSFSCRLGAAADIQRTVFNQHTIPRDLFKKAAKIFKQGLH